MVLAASNTLPDNAGYVAAAYLVFLALILIYVAIMAYKLARIGRDVAELHELADEAEAELPAPREESHV
jgi:hypothetical protein